MRTGNILVGLIFLAVMNSNLVFANLTVNLETTPDAVWLMDVGDNVYSNPGINVSAVCLDGTVDVTDNATWEIRLYDDIDSYKRGDNKPNTEFIFDNAWNYGNYRIEASCKYGNETNRTEKNLEVHKLELFLKETSVQGYIGNTLTIPLDFRVDGSAEMFAGADYELKIGDLPVNINKANNLVLDGTTLNIKVPLDLSFSEGYKDIELTIIYQGYELKISKSNYIYLKSPLTIESVANGVTCKANEICNVNLDLKISYYGVGSVDDFDKNNFLIGVFEGNKMRYTVSPSEVACSSDTQTCKLSLSIPELSSGDYTLSIKSISGLYSSTSTIPLTSVLSLGGEILDASGKGVQVSMMFRNNANGIISKIDSNGGAYNINIVPGDYGVSANFGGGTLIADINNVTFNSEIIKYGSNINFDSFVGSSPITGVHVTKVVVLEFGYGFENAVLTIPYDGTLVNNEDNLKVYRCDKWNFALRRCNGEWKELNSEIYPIPDIVKVNVDKFGAFVLGEQKSLDFNVVSVTEKTIYLGDTIPIEGQVLDSDGEEISGATITLKVENYTSTTTTLSDGSFLGYVTMPYKEGAFELEISADKQPFLPVVEKRVVKTSKKREVSILLPESVSVDIDKSKIIDLTVINSGQVDLTDITILVNGISLKNYNIVPSKINELKPGEQREVKMTVDISSESCGEKCNQYYLVGMEVKAKTKFDEEISSGGSFTIELTKPIKTKEEPKGLFSGISGMFTMPAVSTNNLITGIIGIGIIVLVVLIIKKKKNKTPFYGRTFGGANYNYKKMTMPRSTIVSSMNSIKSQIRNKK